MKTASLSLMKTRVVFWYDIPIKKLTLPGKNVVKVGQNTHLRIW